MKTCSKCKQEKPVTDFYRRKNNHSSLCKKCENEKHRIYYNKNLEKVRRKNREKTRKMNRAFKQKCVDLKGGKCSVCDYSRCLAALEFHHIDPKEKEFTITRSQSSPRKKHDKVLFKKELDKCILVCSNCHREMHQWN